MFEREHPGVRLPGIQVEGGNVCVGSTRINQGGNKGGYGICPDKEVRVQIRKLWRSIGRKEGDGKRRELRLLEGSGGANLGEGVLQLLKRRSRGLERGCLLPLLELLELSEPKEVICPHPANRLRCRLGRRFGHGVFGQVLSGGLIRFGRAFDRSTLFCDLLLGVGSGSSLFLSRRRLCLCCLIFFCFRRGGGRILLSG